MIFGVLYYSSTTISVPSRVGIQEMFDGIHRILWKKIKLAMIKIIINSSTWNKKTF